MCPVCSSDALPLIVRSVSGLSIVVLHGPSAAIHCTVRFWVTPPLSLAPRLLSHYTYGKMPRPRIVYNDYNDLHLFSSLLMMSQTATIT